MAETYAVDRDRIYVLGHSLGALAASSMIQHRGEVAAGCMMMGVPGFGDGAGDAPIRVYLGEVDGVTGRAADASRFLGERRYELVRLADRGHTLAVGDELEGAVRWLLTHRRD